ncbi:MAG: FecR family protein, partial [Candidatus Sulfotelmatobacter sp.]
VNIQYLGVPMYRPRFHSMILTALACALFALPAAADSQVRIVRLSDVQGGVQIDKNTGLGFENAFLNLPITQGTQLRTRDNGRAEIEFEDGSTLRLTPNTTVGFGTLGLTDSGKRISAVNLVDGRAYVNWLGKSGDEFTLNFSREKITITQPAHFRIAASSNEAEVATFKNEIEVVAPSGTVKVDKRKMVTFSADDKEQATVAKNLREDPYDNWDKQSVEYHDQYAKNNSTPYGYGYSDLSYYGAYSNFPGYGMLWQPYFTGVGWNPFMDGAWSWYPGMGYMWASAYPWGWMPYYYGNWVYAPGLGWGWQSGGFNAWHGGLHYVGALASFRAPVAPQGSVTTVVVGKGGPAFTKGLPENLVVNRGSAGLGIARGSVDNLRHLNTQVAKTGSVRVEAAPQFAATATRGGFAFGRDNVPMTAGSMGHTGATSAGHSSGGVSGAHK